MKKNLTIFLGILTAALITLAVTTPAQAGESTRSGPGDQQECRFAEDTFREPRSRKLNLDGALEVYIHNALAAALEITPKELSAREDAGERFIGIALSRGNSFDEAREIMNQAQQEALEKAAAGGVLTQAEADWYSSRGNRGPRNGTGSGALQGTAGLGHPERAGRPSNSVTSWPNSVIPLQR